MLRAENLYKVSKKVFEDFLNSTDFAEEMSANFKILEADADVGCMSSVLYFDFDDNFWFMPLEPVYTCVRRLFVDGGYTVEILLDDDHYDPEEDGCHFYLKVTWGYYTEFDDVIDKMSVRLFNGNTMESEESEESEWYEEPEEFKESADYDGYDEYGEAENEDVDYMAPSTF